MKKILKKIKHKRQQKAQEGALPSSVPNITDKTVEQHREEVLSSARKYIYPLQHSKHKIVLWTTTILLSLLVVFISYCTIALYRYQTTSAFMYRVTQIVPFPIARQGGTLVAYENYLFEVRRYMHFYERQQKLDFSSQSGKDQLADYKKRALQKVIDDAYVKKLAEKNKITVSNQEIEDEITLLRNQGRLGNSDQVLETVLEEFYGWSRNDLKRSLKDQIIKRKLQAKLDTAATEKSNAAINELKAGAKFEDVAKKYSDDPSKEKGGEYGFTINKANSDLPTQVLAALLQLKPGEYSAVVNTGYSLEIVKVIDKKDDSITAAHIVFNLKPLTSAIDDAKDKSPTRAYIKLK